MRLSYVGHLAACPPPAIVRPDAGIGMTTMATAVLIARHERQIVQAFRTGKATSGRHAQSLRTLGLKDSSTLQDLISEHVVRKAGPDRYFFHHETWIARGHMSWRTVAFLGLGALAVVVSALLYMFYR